MLIMVQCIDFRPLSEALRALKSQISSDLLEEAMVLRTSRPQALWSFIELLDEPEYEENANCFKRLSVCFTGVNKTAESGVDLGGPGELILFLVFPSKLGMIQSINRDFTKAQM